MECKLVVLGCGGVGKSCLTLRFVTGRFQEKYDPTIEDSYRKRVPVDDDEDCLLDILDTACPQEFSAMRDRYMVTAGGFVCVYDITSRESFDEVAVLHDRIRRVKDVDRPAVVVVGNKCDLEPQRQVAVAEGAALARSLGGGCAFLETSAKEDVNVQECFFAAVREIRRLNDDNDTKKKKKKQKQKNKTSDNSQRCSLS